MHTNGIVPPPPDLAIPPEQLRAIRGSIVAQERLSIVTERDTLTVRYRVRTRVGASQEQLDELLLGLEQCEKALLEIDLIAREWETEG
jgi:hypothetical protein